ncbi:MAG: 4Fe-4S dicluster domain-containing protein [Dehalococcoidia bacterium]|nr:4Fe-4S dicluster domain-containing protein [Dehalococcoidia bacterium]
MKKIDRRQFITYLVGAAGAVLLTRQALASPSRSSPTSGATTLLTVKKAEPRKYRVDGSGTKPTEGTRFVMVIDAGACIGCRRCVYACKTENNIPDTISPPWIEVFQMKNEVDLTGTPSREDLKTGSTTSYTESPLPGMWYQPVQCNHCDNAPCVRVCPTGATYKTEDGFVLMDYEKCVGCRFCVVACPYSARRFNWIKPQVDQVNVNPLVPVRPVGVVEKCTFCVHRTRDGKLPRCVEVCPVGARHFGNINDPESEVAKIITDTPNFRLLEELNTQPNIRYIVRGKKYTR